jgi:hypothetical protein
MYATRSRPATSRRRLALAATVAAAILIGAVGVATALAAWGTGIEAPLPANASSNPNAALMSLSCASAGNCTAVGSYADNTGAGQGLLVTETAGTWATGVEALLPSDAASNPGVFLNSVSCASAGNCTAVGTYQNSSGGGSGALGIGLLLTETAGSWAPGVKPALPANASSTPVVRLNSVSCASAGNCTAVGNYFDGSGYQGLLLTETAGTWGTGVQANLPANASSNPAVALNSVSCASAGNCTAVGNYSPDGSTGNQGLLLTETAGTWSNGTQAQVPAATGPNTVNIVFRSVSCPSPGNCAAAGTDNTGNVLLLTQSSGTWAAGVYAALPANAASGQAASLLAVSCPPAGGCTAAGYYSDEGRDGLIVNSAKAPTSLTAAPQIAPHGAVGLGVVSATLTSGVVALAGQKITFSDGSRQLCTASTNSKGIATFLVPILDEVLVLLTNRYTATYAGTINYLGSIATTPAITR